MRTIDHKNIIQEKYHQKQQVVTMYKNLIERKKSKSSTLNQIEIKGIEEKLEITRQQLYFLQTKYPQYLI